MSRRSGGGRRAAKLGTSWEKRLDDLHTYLGPHGVHVARCHPEAKVLPGSTYPIYSKAGPPDYIASVRGRLVVAEAKACSKPSWSLAGLWEHQAESLDAFARTGALSCVWLWHQGREWVLPWAELGPLWWAWRDSKRGGRRAKQGTASLTAKQIADIGLPFDRALGWLPAVQGLLENNDG